jgi:UDP-N-acetylmuramoylalanine-D-glutamate ligase
MTLAAFNNSVTVNHDQIRVGETWGDVVGGPPGFIVQPGNIAANVGDSNALAALALCRAIRLPYEPLLDALFKFEGLPHRVQKVAEEALAGKRPPRFTGA